MKNPSAEKKHSLNVAAGPETRSFTSRTRHFRPPTPLDLPEPPAFPMSIQGSFLVHPSQARPRPGQESRRPERSRLALQPPGCHLRLEIIFVQFFWTSTYLGKQN